MSRKVEVQIVGDASSLHKALGSATSGTSKLGGVFGRVAKVAGGLGLALGAVELAKFGMDAVEAAAQVQKSTEAIHADYGKAAESVLKFGENAAKAFGISNAASEAFSAQIGLTAKNIGLAHGKAAEMDIGLQRLAGSIGMIKGQDPTSVFSTLTLALAGNTRGLKSLGIVVTPAAEKLEMMRLHIKGTVSAMTAAQKAQVIYGIATKHLGELQKQAQKHSGDFANEQIKLKAQLANVTDEIGAALLPAVTKLTGWLAKNLPVAIAFVSKEWAAHRAQVMQVVDAITQAVEKNLPQIKATILNVWHAIQVVTKKVWPLIKNQVVTTINIIGDVLHIAMDLIQGHWGAAWGRVKALVSDALHGVLTQLRLVVGLYLEAAAAVGRAILHGLGRGIAGLAHVVSRAFHTVVNTIGGVIGAAMRAAESVGRAIMQGIANGISGLIGWLEGKISSMASGLLDKAKGILHINSPSMVFSDVVGRGIMEGIAHGITKHAVLPHAALAGALMPTGGLSFAGARGATSGGSGGGGHSRPIVVENRLYIDGHEFTTWLREKDKQHRRQNGGQPLLSGV